MSEWSVVQELGDWKTFEDGFVLKGKEPNAKTSYTVKLEQVNKRLDLPFNWRLSIFSFDGRDYKKAHQENFYLNVDNNSNTNAKNKADEIVEAFIESEKSKNK